MKTNEQILVELTTIFQEVLDVDDLVLTMDTKAEDIEEWDSLAHMQLVLAISKYYGVKFTTAEVIQWTDITSIVETIKEHLA